MSSFTVSPDLRLHTWEMGELIFFLTPFLDILGSAGNLVHKCPRCRLFFGTVGEMNKHRVASHHNVFECKICDKLFFSRSKLWQHNQFTHRNDKTLHKRKKSRNSAGMQKCSFCDDMFNTLSELQEHNDARHANEFHECNLCGLSFKRILVHMRGHAKKKPFACEYCGRQFLYRLSLVKHLSVHTGVKPYECGTCKEKFVNPTDHQRHECTQATSCDYSLS